MLFQTTLNKGSFPELWKLSQITPVYKEGSKADVNCCRSISLLYCVSKLLERIIFKRIYSNCRDSLFENQFGFRQRRSATTQLLLFLNSLYAKLDDVKTKELSVLYLDFAKAFDKVYHNKLIEKLHFFEIGGNLLKLIEWYLNKRKQCVKINNALSEKLEITSGVPQGSILGPLLFLFFINDLPSETPLTENFGFADDFKLISVNQEELKKSVEGIENWGDRNHLTLNASKCKLLSLKSEQKASLKNQELGEVDSQRDLGLIVSKKLNWKSNCNHRLSKATKAFYQIKRSMTDSASIKNKLNAYTGYVLPILSYCSQAWLPNRQQMEKIEKLQKRATSWILSGRNCTYKEKLIALKLLPLSVYVEMHDLLLLLSLLDNKFDIKVNFEYQDFEKTRQNARGELKIAKNCLRKTDENFLHRCKRNQFVKLKLLPILKTNVFELYVHRQVKTVLQIVKR